MVGMTDSAVVSNSYTITVSNKPAVDVNADGIVDHRDFLIVSPLLNKKSADAGFNVKYDFNNDGIIDIFDLAILSKSMTPILPKVATPVFINKEGTYTLAQNVTIASVVGSVTKYTIDGSTPTAASSTYVGAITVSKTMTIKIMSMMSGMANSAVATAKYVIAPMVAAPSFSLAPGIYKNTQTVTISSATTQSAIRFTTNGDEPNSTSQLYSSPLILPMSATVKCYASKVGMTDSLVSTAEYVIQQKVIAPTFSVMPGTYMEKQIVSILNPENGGIVRYTIDNSAPTINSPIYTSPIVVSNTTTIRSYISKVGMTDSNPVSATYTIQEKVQAPKLSLDTGTYTSGQTLNLSSTTTGSAIYYTLTDTSLDPINPTTNSTLYTTPINITKSQTVRAYAKKTGFVDSDVAGAIYVISPYRKGAPTDLIATKITNTSFTLNWKAPIDSLGIEGYDIYYNGTILAGSTTKGAIAFNVTGLTADTTYSFTVKSKDLASKIIAISDPLSVKISANNADLVVTDIGYSPSVPSEGEAVTFNATIKNIGKGNTPQGNKSIIEFSLDGGKTFVWVDNLIDGIGADKSVTVSVNAGNIGPTWNAVLGKHTIKATVNPQKLIYEENYSNNSYSKEMIVNKACDLIVTNIMLGDGNPISGAANILSATVQNIGEGASPADRNIKVDFYVDNSPTFSYWSDNYNWSIEPGQSAILKVNSGTTKAEWAPVAGNYNITAVVDGINSIKESDETNNRFTKTIPVTATGVLDPKLDSDGDGLTNDQETLTHLGTDPLKADSDSDGISDFDEIYVYRTNPLNSDSDGDTLYDATEIKNGTDPINTSDTNNKDTARITETADKKVTVMAHGDTNILAAPFQVIKLDNAILKGINGIVGKPIEISMGGYPMTSAEVTFKYDVNQLNGVKAEDLGIYYINEDTNKLEPLDKIKNNIIITKDVANGTVNITGTVNHFSKYLVGDISIDTELANVDIEFAIDQSTSMNSNDANQNRLALVQKFIDKMDAKERIGIINISDASDVKNALTYSNAELYNTITIMKNEVPSGGSNICDAVSVAGFRLIKANTSSSTKLKVIILLSDGLLDDFTEDSLTVQSGAMIYSAQYNRVNNITTNTIALGSKIDAKFLQDIASDGKGKYYTLNNPSEIDALYNQLKSDMLLKKNIAEEFKPNANNVDANQIKRNLSNLGYTEAYIDCDVATNKFVSEYYNGNCQLKANYEKIKLNEKERINYLINCTNMAILGRLIRKAGGTQQVITPISSSLLDKAELIPRLNYDGTKITPENAAVSQIAINYYMKNIYSIDKQLNPLLNPAGLLNRWLIDTYGLATLGKFWDGFGSIFIGMGDSVYGIWDGLCGAVDGVGYMVDHPKETAEGAKFLYKAMHPLQYPEEYLLFTQIMIQVVQNCWNDFDEGDYNKKCRMIGRLVGEIVLVFVSGVAIAEAASVLKDTKLVTGIISKIGKGTMTADAAIVALRKAAEIIKQIKTVIATKIDDLLIYVNKITKLDNCYEMVTPEGIIVRIEKSEISATNTTKIDDIIAKVAAEAVAKIKAIMQGTDVSELAQLVKKITVYDDYCEFVTNEGTVIKMTKVEVPENSFSKLDTLITRQDTVSKYGRINYEMIRKLGLTDVAEVSKNTRVSVDKIIEFKNHMFINKHYLPQPGGKIIKFDYFTADSEIAYAWLTAKTKSFTTNQEAWFKQLLEHELTESKEMIGNGKNMLYDFESYDPIRNEFTKGPHFNAPDSPGYQFEGFDMNLAYD